GGWSCAGKAEEKGSVARSATVARAVHGEDGLLRKEVVEDREDRLLDLAGVLSSANQHQPLAEVDDDEDVGMQAGLLTRLGVAERGREDGELRHIGFALRPAWLAEELAGEEG